MKYKRFNVYLKFIAIILAVFLLCSFLSCDKEAEGKDTYHPSVPIYTTSSSYAETTPREKETYILNTRTKKIHKDSCGTASLILPENREEYKEDIGALYKKGYTKCGNCFK